MNNSLQIKSTNTVNVYANYGLQSLIPSQGFCSVASNFVKIILKTSNLSNSFTSKLLPSKAKYSLKNFPSELQRIILKLLDNKTARKMMLIEKNFFDEKTNKTRQSFYKKLNAIEKEITKSEILEMITKFGWDLCNYGLSPQEENAMLVYFCYSKNIKWKQIDVVMLKQIANFSLLMKRNEESFIDSPFILWYNSMTSPMVNSESKYMAFNASLDVNVIKIFLNKIAQETENREDFLNSVLVTFYRMAITYSNNPVQEFIAEKFPNIKKTSAWKENHPCVLNAIKKLLKNDLTDDELIKFETLLNLLSPNDFAVYCPELPRNKEFNCDHLNVNTKQQLLKIVEKSGIIGLREQMDPSIDIMPRILDGSVKVFHLH